MSAAGSGTASRRWPASHGRLGRDAAGRDLPGQRLVPAFTSACGAVFRAGLRAQPPQVVRHVVVSAAELARRLPATLGIALNPVPSRACWCTRRASRTWPRRRLPGSRPIRVGHPPPCRGADRRDPVPAAFGSGRPGGGGRVALGRFRRGGTGHLGRAGRSGGRGRARRGGRDRAGRGRRAAGRRVPHRRDIPRRGRARLG